MLAIAVTDFRYLIIPNELTAAAFALAIINAAVGESTSIVEGVAAAALRGSITMLLFLAIRSIYAWLRHQEGIGLGDVKLACVAGAWLDWVMIPVAIEIAALVALTAYVVRQIVSKQPINSTSRLPFGLFFAPAIWLSWLLSKMIFGPSWRLQIDPEASSSRTDRRTRFLAHQNVPTGLENRAQLIE
jgi:leader peptidase (prepilin peptidase)/N-methyltransferase